MTHKEERDILVTALHDLWRCPGVFTTDQRTGETFADIIQNALEKVGADNGR